MSYNFRLVNIFGLPIIPGLFDILKVSLEYVHGQFRPLEKILLAYYYAMLFIFVIRLIRYLKEHPEGFNIEDNRG